MSTTVELASVPSADTPGTCIYLHHDKRSYIFGRVGEGTQRAFGSRKIHMGGTEQVFLSGPVCWEQLGGLVGYLLSIGGAVDAAREHQQMENSKREQLGRKLLKQTEHAGVGVHGADNLCHVLAACRAVVFRQSIGVRPYEHRQDPRAQDPQNEDPDWSDDALRVWKIPVQRARSSSPLKRRRSSADVSNGSDDFSHKPATSLSDPEVSRHIIEKIIFNGSVNNQSVLLPKKIGELKETDIAVTNENGTLRVYNGPYAAEGATIPNADGQAWVFPDTTAPETPVALDEKDVLAINHHPLPRTKYGETAMSYIAKCHERRGKFNPAVAKSCGIEPKDFKLLTSGQSVTAKDGTVVTPEMVLGEPQPGKGIVVADIPSRDFVEAFLERPEWTNTNIMSHVAVMYWILGQDIATDSRILDFMQARPDIKHVLCASNTCPNMITHPGAAETHTRLRKIDPDRFSIIGFDNKVSYPAPSSESIELGRAGKRLTLMPRLIFDDKNVAPFPDLVAAFNSVDEEVLALAQAAKAESTDPKFLARIEAQEQNIPNRDAEIIPLGTGSSVPSKHRNVSGTLIRVPGIGSYLMDCGEGTLGQIERLFGREETINVLRELQCIVVSHVHADHHLGAASLIKAWYEQTLADGRNNKLAISCIGRYRALLEEISQVDDIGFHRLRFPSCPQANQRDRDITTKKDLAEYEQDFGLAGIKRIPVPHCWRSYGTELELTSGLRIAYSGDCRPSSKFAQACRGAHLLIHECTFGDDMQDHARAKKHSTMAEALGVAKEMEARRTLLTHFSQRYTKSESLRRERNDGEEQGVLLAFDLMRVKLGDFQKAACFIPAIEKLMEKLAD
ncbi:hypothetical protein Golomagni_05590 [Golovinomyces magnicellulatus]|nr:hypothetical protein Golomagni_05590 [Golovinomyces magnicellulatus]